MTLNIWIFLSVIQDPPRCDRWKCPARLSAKKCADIRDLKISRYHRPYLDFLIIIDTLSETNSDRSSSLFMKYNIYLLFPPRTEAGIHAGSMLGGPSSINWAISYPADKDCRIENTGKETRKHSSSLLLLIHWPALSCPRIEILIFYTPGFSSNISNHNLRTLLKLQLEGWFISYPDHISLLRLFQMIQAINVTSIL